MGEKLVFSRGSLSSSLSTSQFMQDARSCSSKHSRQAFSNGLQGQPGCSLVLCLLYLSTVVMDLPL